MASVRRLKKDIDCIIFEVISDCFSFGSLHPDEKNEEVTAILADAVELRNDLVRRVNNPENNSDAKALRAHFQNVVKDLHTGVDKLCLRLSSLPEAKK